VKAKSWNGKERREWKGMEGMERDGGIEGRKGCKSAKGGRREYLSYQTSTPSQLCIVRSSKTPAASSGDLLS